tara:strand:+ start:3614 stop:4258 length:645 start_codon:yes stop_codon:yes gene_type:complete
MYNFSNFIVLKQDTLEKEFCEHVIDKFEKDDRKMAGVVGTVAHINTDLKRSTDLSISRLEEWKEEDQTFFDSLASGIENYAEQDFLKELSFDEEQTGEIGLLYAPMQDTGYNIQRTKPGEYYKWHHDWTHSKNSGSRVMTYIWYLNDITKGGGYTDFLDGTRITPKQGTLLMFPATWNYYHRGFPPEEETKYISTGWLYHSWDNAFKSEPEKLD